MATILYDNDSPHFSFSKSGLIDDTMLLGSTGTLADLGSDALEVSVTFSGTSIALFGDTNDLTSTQPIDVILDGEVSAVQINRLAGDETSTDELLHVFYQSPPLPDATHNLTIRGAQEDGNLLIDYATVTAGRNTSLKGERLIVDDSDSSVIYEGDWVHSTNSIIHLASDSSARRYPYANTTHQTSSDGASATFQFNGTSVSVVGVSSGTFINFLVEMDGKNVAFSSQDLTQISTNFPWYTVDGLFPTNHTLKLVFSGSVSNTTVPLILDYIIYTPSFTSLAEKEGSSPQQPSSTQSQLTLTSSSQSQTTSSSGSQSQTTPQISSVPPPNQPSHKLLLGVIIGPTLFAVIIIVLLFMYKKKLLFRSSRRINTVHPFQLPQPLPQGPLQPQVYHKSSTISGSNVSRNPTSDHDLPLVGVSSTSHGTSATTHRHVQWWSRLWHTEPGILEAFPPPLSHRPMIQHKPSLPAWTLHAAQQRASHHSIETIVADPRVHELEEMVLALQEEIEVTRQNQSGVQNGALMRELVTTTTTRNDLLDEHGQENGDLGSLAISTTVL